MRNTVPWTYFKAPFRWQFLLAVIHFPVQMIPSVCLLTAHLSSKGPSFATFASDSFSNDACIQETQAVLLSRPVICMAPGCVLVFGLSAVCPWYSLCHHRNGSTCRVQCCVWYYRPRILQSLAHLRYMGGEVYSMWILGTSQALLLCWCSFVWSTAATHPVEWR